MKWDEGNKRIAMSALPSLPGPLTNASITANGRMIYVAGGETPDAVSNSFLCLDLDDTAAGWKSLPALPHRLSHAVLAFSGKVMYLAGGRKRNAHSTSTLYSALHAYDIQEKKWMRKAALPYALSAATGIAFADGVMIFGGDKGETFHRTELLIAQMNAATNASERKKLNEQKSALQSGHPGFSREVLHYHPLSNEWKVIDTIPYEVPVTTTVFKWDDDFMIPSGEIKAGIRTPNILAGKLTE